MKRPKFLDKKQRIRNEQTLQKKHYRILIGLMIFGIAYYYFIEPKTIGHDIRYSIYIFWLPISVGMLALGVYRRQFLISRLAANTGVFLKTITIFFYLAQGLIVSYLSFGQLSKISWDFANYQFANQNLTQDINCDVTRFWTKRRPYSFDFEFNKKHESFKVRYEDIKQYQDKKPEAYVVCIKAKKGIWNYYLIESWSIKEKNTARISWRN